MENVGYFSDFEHFFLESIVLESGLKTPFCRDWWRNNLLLRLTKSEVSGFGGVCDRFFANISVNNQSISINFFFVKDNHNFEIEV